MLGVTGTTLPAVLRQPTITTPTPLSLFSQCQTNKPPLIHLGSSGYRLFARKKEKDSTFKTIVLKKDETLQDDDVGEEFVDEFEGLEYDDDINDLEDDDDDDEDDELMVPIHRAEEFLRNKPRGFGEGKVYDTSLEDKLFVEIEKSRKAQIANLVNLRNQKVIDKKAKKPLQASEGVSSGIRVRMNHLPKKKNVERDLKVAFKGVRGITSILPAVIGTKKTRDPICKGFGFLDFKTMLDAESFVKAFSQQKITFGRVEKRIKFEILDPRGANSEESVRIVRKPTSHMRVALLEGEGDQDSADGQNDVTLMVSEDDDDIEEFSEDLGDAELNEFGENFGDDDIDESGEAFGDDGHSDREIGMENAANSMSSKPKKKTKAIKKKPSEKAKKGGSQKVTIPGSAAKRLKDKDKETLAQAFARYAKRA